jgi:hypothetical protein
MISQKMLLAISLALLCYIIYNNNQVEAFTVQSAYNRSMRYMRYNAHPRITRFVTTIMNTSRRFIPGL